MFGHFSQHLINLRKIASSAMISKKEWLFIAKSSLYISETCKISSSEFGLLPGSKITMLEDQQWWQMTRSFENFEMTSKWPSNDLVIWGHLSFRSFRILAKFKLNVKSKWARIKYKKKIKIILTRIIRLHDIISSNDYVICHLTSNDLQMTGHLSFSHLRSFRSLTITAEYSKNEFLTWFPNYQLIIVSFFFLPSNHKLTIFVHNLLHGEQLKIILLQVIANKVVLVYTFSTS